MFITNLIPVQNSNFKAGEKKYCLVSKSFQFAKRSEKWEAADATREIKVAAAIKETRAKAEVITAAERDADSTITLGVEQDAALERAPEEDWVEGRCLVSLLRRLRNRFKYHPTPRLCCPW